MATDPVLAAHKQWIGYLQPVGLVVAPHALVAAQAVVSEHVSEPQQRLKALPRPFPLRALLQDILGWRPSDLAEPPPALEHPLPEYGETLRPTFAVPSGSPDHPWLLLVQDLSPGTALDATPLASSHGWDAPPQAKFERLLRETNVPIGLLHNGEFLRLVHAPRGETSGHLSFPLDFMTTVAGRQSLGACIMLLGADRLFSESDNRRLPALLSESRKYQNEVSTRLAEQVLGALLELLRGFQAADEATRGLLLASLSREDPQHIYGGLLTVLLRLVFLLYAEDRGLMPGDPTWASHYSVTGLYLQLREDAGRHPDTMDLRFGAWSALLSLFRLVFTGGTHDRLHLPARHGRLFDPDSYPFLEGRARGDAWQPGEHRDAPRVPDGVLWRVLQSLLVLDGERLSYRSLDVEQIGSVYESMMGFKLERANGPSIAVRPQHVVVDLAALLSQKPDARAKLLKEQAGCDLTGTSLAALKSAKTPDDAVAALGRKTSPRTPTLIPAGSLYLQPGEERRKSGSHYTPRSLTGPIVRTTLRPILEALGDRPTAAQILDIKLCDPAMGSGAFLVEACRQLGDHLLRAWDIHKNTPQIPPDEDPLLHARRLVAQQCLYGVDKNPFAVDLAKLSLWLVTLAKDHPFTFLDHAFKHGDSLVGLTKAQIAEFRWDHETRHHGSLFEHMRQQVGKATILRREIHTLGDDGEASKREALRAADDATHDAKLIGDAAIAAFFSEDSDKKRLQRLGELDKETVQPAQKGDSRANKKLQQLADDLRAGTKPVFPFHWEIEFPEVFDRENPGFDCVVGNPPFLGGTRISTVCGMTYFDYLVQAFPKAGHLCDLVAYFFRRAFVLTRQLGALGLIATNTIGQGDTRAGGLSVIAATGGTLYNATRRVRWARGAAVMVSVVHIFNGPFHGQRILDNKPAEKITAYLFSKGGNNEPARLAGMNEQFSAGSKIYGQGFLFDDTDTAASPIALMHELKRINPGNAERIFPYIGGQEINQNPRQEPNRFVIQLSDLATEEEVKRWPQLMDIVRKKVKPERDLLGDNPNNTPLRRRWWAYQAHRPTLYEKLATLRHVLVNSQVSSHFAFALQPSDRIFAHTINVFISESFGFFAIMQSRTHEIWARFFGSSMKDDLRYTPSDCFETFPFPQKSEQEHPAVIAMGQVYHQYRAELMIKNDHGLTATYNRFHDPDEQSPDILKLRELHAEMDRAVLTAYGWTDLAERATCEFRLDYEDDDESSDDEAPRARAKKKPWRYRWPQDFHDEVLARLLDLNQQRAEEERLAGAAANTGTGTTKKGPASPRKKPSARQAAPILALPFAPVAAQEAPTTVRTTSEEPTQRPLVLPEVQRPTRVTVLGKLVLILCDLFPRDDDFRHWVRDIEPELRMWVDLPGSGSPLRALIQDGIDLFDRHGLLTPEFIGRLRRDHPSAAHGFHEIAIGLFDHSDDLDTIQMVAPKDEQQSLAARLDLLYKQHRQRAIEAQDCSDLEQQIRAIRKELRSPTFHAGDWLGNGRFRLTHYSGKGGFATVWQAYDRDIGTPAAVKLLHPHILNDATERNRFIRGSRIMAALNHPHIARIRRSATNEDGHYYYAMDYLPNGDLNDAVTAGKINLRQRLAIVADVAEAMAYAHRLNIIHRDIKPSNILIDAEHHGILSDFDLVRAPGTEGGTRTNNMLGSLYYAAPEALNFSVPVSTQSDVYSLGMVLLFCLVGQNFTTKEALVNPETLLEPLPIPAPLKSMVQSCLAYAANDRTITMSDIHQHLIRYLNS